MWADNFWLLSHSKKNLEEMLQDIIEEARRRDHSHDTASLWETSTCKVEKQI